MTRVLVIGGGGREHALVHALKRSASTQQVFCAPGNDGIARDCPCFDYEDYDDLRAQVTQRDIDLVVVGPEQPLVDGIVDALAANTSTKVFGPTRAAAQLEGSKVFMKQVAQAAGVPTATFAAFDDLHKALGYLDEHSAPIVVKTDGLAAGKGVVVATDLAEARAAVIDCLSGGKFGEAGARVVLEEFLEGPEVSVFHVVRGGKATYLGAAQDHKRLLDGDQGPNTGGMGTFAPTALMNDDLLGTVERQIVYPTLAEMARQGCPFEGFLFTGLMLTAQGPKLLEFNIRMGDPETQSLMPLLQGDLTALLMGREDTDAGMSVKVGAMHALTVVLAAPGYPQAPQKGLALPAVPGGDQVSQQVVFTVAGAGKSSSGQWQSQGGRVLGVTGVGQTPSQARAAAYQAVDAYGWHEAQYRNDIGQPAPTNGTN